MYMLFDVVPSVEITGGAWFTDNELDTEFVLTLSDACVRFIQSRVCCCTLCLYACTCDLMHALMDTGLSTTAISSSIINIR